MRRIQPFNFSACATLSLLMSASFVNAETISDSKYKLSGFATFAYAKGIDLEKNSIGETQAVSGITSNSGEYRDFNKLGLRLDVDMGDRLSFATQMLAEGVKDYETEFDWIYVNYRASQYLDVKVGKTRIPLFYYSDYLDVGYALPWITAPNAVYGDGPFKTVEGVNLSYSRPMGPLDSELQVYAGQSDENIVLPNYELDLVLENMQGVAWTVGYEWIEVRASYFEAKSTGSNETLDTLYTTLFDPTYGLGAVLGGDYVDDLVWEEDEPTFLGLGINMDFGDYFILSEATRVRDGDSAIVADVNSYYITVGTRIIDDWTFSLTYSNNDDELNDNVEQALADYNAQAFDSFGALSVPVAAAIGAASGGSPVIAQALTEAVYGLPVVVQQSEHESDNYNLAVRWDFHPSADVKFEYLYEKHTPFESDDSLNGNAFRVALDIIF